MIFTCLLLFFLLEYVRPTSYWPGLLALHLNSIIPVSGFLGTIVTAGQKTVQRMAAETNTKIIATILALIFMSFLTADVQDYAWNSFMVVLGFALMYWVIGCEVTTVRKLKILIVAMIVTHLVVAALNPVLFTDPETRHYVSSGAFLGDGNDFALSIDIIIPLCLFLLLDTKRFIVKLVCIAAILVLVAGVVVSQSRGGTIGLACTAIYFWAKSKKKVQTGIVGALVFVLILAFAPGNYFTRMRMIGDTSEGSASARLEAWGIAFQMALDSPLLGVGAGHFGVKIGNEYRPAGFVGRGMNAHSIYFMALGEFGFPGIIVLLYFFYWNLKENALLAKQLKARDSPALQSHAQVLATTSAALIAFASAGAFLSALYYPHLYILAGVLTASRNVVRERLAAVDPAAEKPVATREVALHWSLRPRPAIGAGAGAGGGLTSRTGDSSVS